MEQSDPVAFKVNFRRNFNFRPASSRQFSLFRAVAALCPYGHWGWGASLEEKKRGQWEELAVGGVDGTAALRPFIGLRAGHVTAGRRPTPGQAPPPSGLLLSSTGNDVGSIYFLIYRRRKNG